jgi:hypothetical protein
MCHKFKQIQWCCKSSIVCFHCSKSGHGNTLCPNPSCCVNCDNRHTSADKKWSALFCRWKGHIGIKVKEGLTFPKVHKWFIESHENTSKESYSSVVRCPNGIGIKTQITVLPPSEHTVSFNIISQVSIYTHTEMSA